jgi:hypothetical protein
VLDRGPPEEAPGHGPALNLARRGFATSGTAGPLTAERVGEDAAGGGFALYNVINPVAFRDNFYQSVFELVAFRNLVETLRIDPEECPGVDASAAPDGGIRFDPVVIMGQSLGSYLAGMVAALDRRYRGAILTGAGGSWIEFPSGTNTPVDLDAALKLLVGLPVGESLDRYHPVLALFALAMGPVDNTLYVPRLWRDPGDADPVHVLVIEGDEDVYIGPGLQRALVTAAGVDLVGDDVGPEQDRIMDAILLADGTSLPPPVAGNRRFRDRPVTAGVVRYAPLSPGRGHDVTFDLTAPKHQYECFVETLLAQEMPTIVRGGSSGEPCD